MDTGFDGFNDRDASRIARVVKEEAGLKRLDHVLISHFHADHVGGLAALSQRVEIGSFIDHGETVEKSPKDGRSGIGTSPSPATAAAPSSPGSA